MMNPLKLTAICFLVFQVADAGRLYRRVKRQGFQLSHQEPDSCTTPDDTPGSCLPPTSCPSIHRILTTSPVPRHLYAFLRESICGRTNGRPDFCCPREPTKMVVFGGKVGPALLPVTIPTTSSVITEPTTAEPALVDPSESSSSTTSPISPTSENTPQTVTPEMNLVTNSSGQPPTSSVETTNVDTGLQTSTVETTTAPDVETSPSVTQSSALTSETAIVDIGPLTNSSESSIPEDTGTRLACGRPPTSIIVRIVNGRVVTPHDWPWVAVLGYTNAGGEVTFSCGATLVSTRHVLTAAHCVDGQPSLSVVRLGEHDLSSDEGMAHEDFGIVRKTIHEGYDKTFQNDIAMLELDREVVFKGHISPVCLPDPDVFPNTDLLDKKPVVAGWGATDYNARSSDVLRDVNLPVVDLTTCKKAYARFKTVTVDHRTLCAGYADGGKDACQGDSGGPLFLPHYTLATGTKYFLVGVVSLGFKCAEAGFPGIYTRVTSFLPWIHQNLE